MATINYAAREISVKIVYYGPGLSGKTTNLQVIHRKIPIESKSDMVSLATETDRTLFFDFLPLDLGKIRGFATKFQLYTVPGQVYYNATRKLVLRGVDGIVFVADSTAEKMYENLESFKNMEENLAEYGYQRELIPIVIQYNKQDLPNALPPHYLNTQVNKYNFPWNEAVANKGKGVFESLKSIGKLVIDMLNQRYAPTSPTKTMGGPKPAAVPGKQMQQPKPSVVPETTSIQPPQRYQNPSQPMTQQKPSLSSQQAMHSLPQNNQQQTHAIPPFPPQQFNPMPQQGFTPPQQQMPQNKQGIGSTPFSPDMYGAIQFDQPQQIQTPNPAISQGQAVYEQLEKTSLDMEIERYYNAVPNQQPYNQQQPQNQAFGPKLGASPMQQPSHVQQSGYPQQSQPFYQPNQQMVPPNMQQQPFQQPMSPTPVQGYELPNLDQFAQTQMMPPPAQFQQEAGPQFNTYGNEYGTSDVNNIHEPFDQTMNTEAEVGVPGEDNQMYFTSGTSDKFKRTKKPVNPKLKQKKSLFDKFFKKEGE